MTEGYGCMKPLTEIVAELERRTGGIRTRSMEKTVNVNEIELCRLLAAFRAGEKMRDGCGMAGHNMKPHGDCLVCSAMAAFDAAVKGDGE